MDQIQVRRTRRHARAVAEREAARLSGIRGRRLREDRESLEPGIRRSRPREHEAARCVEGEGLQLKRRREADAQRPERSKHGPARQIEPEQTGSIGRPGERQCKVIAEPSAGNLKPQTLRGHWPHAHAAKSSVTPTAR